MKKSISIFYLIALVILLSASCIAKKGIVSNKNGFYSMQIFKSSNDDAAILCGSLYDFDSKTLLKTNGAIKVDGVIKVKTDAEGKFILNLIPGKHTFTGFGMPYSFLTTKITDVHKGDSIKLVMYLKPDATPSHD